MLQKKRFTKDEALPKIRHYCSYQERCHSEVKEKLYGFGLFKSEAEEILSNLIEDNYLNEERFAIQFAGGKFRMNDWGRKKIAYALQQKNVSTYCINKGLKEIDTADYQHKLEKLARTKWDVLKNEQYLNRQAKTYAYLLQKGYEHKEIAPVINELKAKPAK